MGGADKMKPSVGREQRLASEERQIFIRASSRVESSRVESSRVTKFRLVFWTQRAYPYLKQS